MALQPHAPLPEDTAASVGPGAVQLDLLRIVCAVAWCDGDFSDEEQRLLAEIVARYLSPADGAGPSPQAVELIASRSAAPELIETLTHQLASAEDRRLAVKLAYMMVRVSGRPGDSSAINQREKHAYRRLVEAAGLDAREVEATEWAAEAELNSLDGGLLGLLRRSFGNLASWPDASLLQQPGAPRL